MDNQKEQTVELFDLDHTLFKVNSSFKFGVYLYKNKHLHLMKMLFLMGCYGFHKLGLLSIASIHKISARCLFAGKSLISLDKFVLEFLDKEFDKLLNPSVVNRLLLAQANGAYTVILSSSPDFLVHRIAEKFKVNEWESTRYTVNANQILQGISKTIDGHAKADFVIAIIAKLGITKQNIAGYSDSHLDIPFLEEVGIPVAVNPDKYLRKTCKEKGWQIIDH
jgi:HAD superfamily phosphoserine phosphatase-like hydrolase